MSSAVSWMIEVNCRPLSWTFVFSQNKYGLQNFNYRMKYGLSYNINNVFILASFYTDDDCSLHLVKLDDALNVISSIFVLFIILY
jgi:hypothetical protein